MKSKLETDYVTVAADHPKTKEKRVLVADDDPAILDMLGIILMNAGYTMELKSDGADILNGSYVVPHLFIIDRQLSSHDGLEICRHLKAEALTKNIPVIIISATPDIAKAAMEACADGYLEKPFEMKRLLQLVKEHIDSPRF